MHSSRLTEGEVLDIRALYATGSVLQRELAARFGVHIMTINDILKRRTWVHLTERALPADRAGEALR